MVYIGKAGGSGKQATLHSRLKQYLNFGQGKPVGHWGGRLIWQLKHSSDLIICWKTLPTIEPREYESELINYLFLNLVNDLFKPCRLMTPRDYEELISDHFRQQGYVPETTSYINDYGVDIFATKGKEKIAIQAKMYGSGRKINRQMVMELFGAKEYFDCTKAVIATDGVFLQDAILVAEKLKIEILNINALPHTIKIDTTHKQKTFEAIWEDYIIPLQGKSLLRDNGEIN